jgi:hypothetical protein
VQQVANVIVEFVEVLFGPPFQSYTVWKHGIVGLGQL